MKLHFLRYTAGKMLKSRFRKLKKSHNWRLRRSVGITAVVAEAMLRSDRLGIALGDGKASAKRRKEAKTRYWTWRDEMSRRGTPFGGRGWANFDE